MSQVIKIISFVPSWTETLIEAGVSVVGCTRYCIHPKHIVQDIPIVGGTKKILIDECLKLKPDLIIFDKEENNLEMTQLCDLHQLKWIATHVVDLKSCGEELLKLSILLKNEQLKIWGEKYLQIAHEDVFSEEKRSRIFQSIILNSDRLATDFKVQDYQIQYLIWNEPLMAITRQTFIGDVLAKLSLFAPDMQEGGSKYPEISFDSLKDKYCLFSSEPYPFEKKYSELIQQGLKGCLVDGEKVSWYGIRCLRTLNG